MSDLDRARDHFRKKNRALVRKVMHVKDAVAQLVNDGNYLGIGGFGGVRIPTAALHEIAAAENTPPETIETELRAIRASHRLNDRPAAP